MFFISIWPKPTPYCKRNYIHNIFSPFFAHYLRVVIELQKYSRQWKSRWTCVTGCKLLLAPNVPALIMDTKTFLKFHLFQKWKRGWENIPTTNKLKNIKPSAEFWTTALRITRKEEVSLCRFRIDHTRITHSHLLNKTPPPLYQSCSVQITVQHLLIECPLYQNYRIKFDIPSSINSLLKNDEPTITISFYKSSGLLPKI